MDRAQITRNKILSIAATEFSHKDYKDVKIADIAKKSGVSKSLLYYHFEDKEALVIESYQEIVLSRVKNIRGKTFKKVVLLLLNVFSEHPAYGKNIHSLLSETGSKHHDSLRSTLTEVLLSCRDVDENNLNEYHVSMVSLFAHPLIMNSLDEIDFSFKKLLKLYDTILS